jgi:hypothetical protein
MAKTKGSRKSSRKQKVYNMRGCSKTRKNYLGGSTDTPLAYTGQKMPSFSNPHLVPTQLLSSYTGKGGSSCGLTTPSVPSTNINGGNPVQPNTGPPFKLGGNIFSNASQQSGGCGCGLPAMTGGGKRRGGCGPLCSMGFMVGGVRHRVACKCSNCKKRIMKGGNPGIPYPNGLVGSAWTPNASGWPGVDGVDGNRNYIANNTYTNDVSRQMVDVGANPPFLKGGKRKQKGGTVSNFMTQDLINLGRQFQFGLGSAYNALAGYSSPVNPLPWRDQLPTRTPFNPAAL